MGTFVMYPINTPNTGVWATNIYGIGDTMMLNLVPSLSNLNGMDQYLNNLTHRGTGHRISLIVHKSIQTGFFDCPHTKHDTETTAVVCVVIDREQV